MSQLLPKINSSIRENKTSEKVFAGFVLGSAFFLELQQTILLASKSWWKSLDACLLIAACLAGWLFSETPNVPLYPKTANFVPQEKPLLLKRAGTQLSIQTTILL